MKPMQSPLTPVAAILALAVLGLTVACVYPMHDRGRHRGYEHEQQHGPEHGQGHGPEYHPM